MGSYDGYADTIKGSVSMADVLASCGVQAREKGRIPCPLHGGKGRNFAYDRGRFKCFVCGEGGSVIDFEMKLYGLEFKQAVERIAADYGLPTPRELTEQDRAAMRRAREEKRRQREEMEAKRREAEYEWAKALDRWLVLMRIIERFKPKKPDEEFSEPFAYALSELASARADAEYAEDKRRGVSMSG